MKLSRPAGPVKPLTSTFVLVGLQARRPQRKEVPVKVHNTHERRLAATPDRVGALLDALASDADRLWPGRTWPRMAFDRPLAVGASGGHGPIRYTVEAYEPGRAIRFRFTGPAGFDGWHGFDVIPAPDGTVLRHTVAMQARGRARLSWPLLYGPLHDALLEDALAQAQATLGLAPDIPPWPHRVRLLRWLLSAGRAPGQRTARHVT